MGSKSRFLEELIAEKTTPSTNIIDRIWEVPSPEFNTVSSSILETLTSDTSPLTTGDAWLNNLDVHAKNTNNTVRDTTITGVKQVTANLEALPITKHMTQYMFTSNLPEGYVTCTLTVSKGASTKSIQVLFPKSFSRSIQATFSKQNPVGSNKAIMAYAYTDSETIPFSFDCLSEYLPQGYNSLQAYIDDIMSILKPSYSSKNVVLEPRVHFQIADLEFDCVCTSVNVDYDMLFDGESRRKSFAHAVVSLNLTSI